MRYGCRIGMTVPERLEAHEELHLYTLSGQLDSVWDGGCCDKDTFHDGALQCMHVNE